MRELRAVALSEDGGYLVLADASSRTDNEQFRVPVDDRLRAALRGARRSEVRTESALTPREIQARLRAGETAADVARAAGIPVERVERYEGPVLAERARVVQEARAALLPKDQGGAPGRPLGEVVDSRLLAGQDDPDTAQWDAWRRVDGIWLVQLTSESRCARWTWDPVVRRVRPHDDAARALVAPEPVDAPPPQNGAAPAARQSPPALTLVADPALTGPRPLPAAPSGFPDARPRYPQSAQFPGAAPGYPEPTTNPPARLEPLYGAPQVPAARFPHPDTATGPIPIGREDLGASPYQDPRFQPGPRPDQQYPAARYPAGYEQDPRYPVGPETVAPPGVYGTDAPFGDPAYPAPYATGPLPVTEPGYGEALAYGAETNGYRGGEMDPALFAPPGSGRPHRPAAAQRPTRPPALDPRAATGHLDGRRWPDHLDEEQFDEASSAATPPVPRPLARPSTAPPRGGTVPPRPVVPPRPAAATPPLDVLPALGTTPPPPLGTAPPLGMPRPAPAPPPAAVVYETPGGHRVAAVVATPEPHQPTPAPAAAIGDLSDLPDLPDLPEALAAGDAGAPEAVIAPPAAARPATAPARRGSRAPANAVAQPSAPVAPATADGREQVPGPAVQAASVADSAVPADAAAAPATGTPVEESEPTAVPVSDEPSAAEAAPATVAAPPVAETEEEVEAKPDVTKRTPAAGGNRLAAAAAAARAGEKADKSEKTTGKNQDTAPGSPATEGDGAATPTPSNRPRNAPRTGERAGGGRRGRKSVPAWDDIVFGARRT